MTATTTGFDMDLPLPLDGGDDDAMPADQID